MLKDQNFNINKYEVALNLINQIYWTFQKTSKSKTLNSFGFKYKNTIKYFYANPIELNLLKK